MFCSKCGNELPEGSRFCNKCGNEIKISLDNVTKETTEKIEMKPVDKEPRLLDTGATVKKTKKKKDQFLIL